MKASSEPREVRKFGLVALIFFGSLTGITIWREKDVPMVFFGCLACLGLLFLLIPGVMAPVHRGWLAVAHFIGKTVTATMMTFAYFLVITPFGFVRRVFGGSPLPLKPNPASDTYWVTRQEPAQPKERFRKRY